jgi:hypothetical protein
MRRLMIYVCLAVVLAAALTPLTSALPWAILNPVLLFFGLVVAITLVFELQPRDAQPLALLSIPGSRAPPR